MVICEIAFLSVSTEAKDVCQEYYKTSLLFCLFWSVLYFSIPTMKQKLFRSKMKK